MLALRPNCEHCDRDLPPESTEAMICTFECTFCTACATGLLGNVCPNCGGGFERRPVRPREKLASRPASTERVFKPVDLESHAKLVARYGTIPPAQR